MPSRLKRYQETGDSHFITFSCHERRPYLRSLASCHLFEQVLESMRIRYCFDVFGYVVMPEHVHLLVSEPVHGLLATAIQALKVSIAKRRSERPFWLARYYDFNVYSAEKRIEKLKYMHRNPVTRGLVASPEDWLFSSYRAYLTGESGIVQITGLMSQKRDMGHPHPTHRLDK